VRVWTEGDEPVHYTVQDDYDHQGIHKATYRLRRNADGTATYSKQKQFDVEAMTSEKHVVVGVDSVLQSVRITESFVTGNQYKDASSASLRQIRGHERLRPQRTMSTLVTENQQGSFLETHTRQLVEDHVVLDRTGWSERSIRRALGHEQDLHIVDDDAYDMDDISWNAGGETTITLVSSYERQHRAVEPNDLLNDILEQKRDPDELPPWETTYGQIVDSLDCLEAANDQASARVGDCHSQLLQAVQKTSEENIAWLGQVYLAKDMIPFRRSRIIDALIEHSSPAAQQAIIDQVLSAQEPLMGDLSRALTDIATMRVPPTKAMMDTMRRIVFDPSTASNRVQAQTIREQAILALGALIQHLMASDPVEAESLTRRLVGWLYDDGPQYSSKARRSKVETEADHRLVVLYALGNSRHPLCIDHILRHVNGSTEEEIFTTKSHRIRNTAVTALGDFEGSYVEEALLQAAYTDANMAIRRNAISRFRSAKRVRSEDSFELPKIVPESPHIQALHDHQMQFLQGGPETSFAETEKAFCTSLNSTEEWHLCLEEHKQYRRTRSLQPRRRALFGLVLDIKIELPNVGFSLPIGSDSIGAEFGLKFSAMTRIYFSILKSLFRVDIAGESYGTLKLGFMQSIVGFSKLDVFRATAAFKGQVGYDLSMIADFDIDDITRMFNKVQTAAVTLMNNLNEAVDLIKQVLGLEGGCDAKCRFEQLMSAVEEMPKTALRLKDFLINLDDYVGPNATQPVESTKLRRLLLALYGISSSANNDMTTMYTLVFDTVKVTLPELATNMTNNVKLIFEALQALPDCPVAATFALLTAKERFEAAVILMLVLKGQFEDAFYITSGEWPGWLNPSKGIIVILKELAIYLVYHAQVMNWNCASASPANPLACQINRSTYNEELSVDPLILQLGVFGEVSKFIQETILPPINTVTKLYADITRAWDFLKRVYDKARAVFDFLFGVRFHKTFARNVRDVSQSCGSGLYPASYNGAVSAAESEKWGPGADILVIMAEQCDIQCQENPKQAYKEDPYAKKKGTQTSSGSKKTSTSQVVSKKYIVAPLQGNLFFEAGNKDLLVLQSPSFSVKKLEFVIGNIVLLPEISKAISSAGSSGFAVKAGYQLGTPIVRRDCEDFVHVSVRLRSDKTNFSDPKPFLTKPFLSVPKWESEADQWFIKLLGKTIKQGTFGALFQSKSDDPNREKKSGKAAAPKKKETQFK